MHKLLNPLVNLATAHLLTFSRWAVAPETPPGEQRLENRLESLWQATMANQAQFAEEWVQGWQQVLARQRRLLDSPLSEQARQLSAQFAYATARAVGIATQARRARRDRRIFSLPLPLDRRQTARGDRRLRAGDGSLRRPVQAAT